MERSETGTRNIDSDQDRVAHLWRQPAGRVLLAYSTSDHPCRGQGGRASALGQLPDQASSMLIVDFAAVNANHLSEILRAAQHPHVVPVYQIGYPNWVARFPTPSNDRTLSPSPLVFARKRFCTPHSTSPSRMQRLDQLKQRRCLNPGDCGAVAGRGGARDWMVRTRCRLVLLHHLGGGVLRYGVVIFRTHHVPGWPTTQ